MDGVQTTIVKMLMLAQFLVIAPTLAFGIHLTWRIPDVNAGRRKTGIGLLVIASLFIVWMFVTLASAPPFDFIDRCRPPGTGFCEDGRTFMAVRLEILGEFLLVALLYIALPIGLGAGGILLILRRITGKIAVK
ncbi:MAG: hypothetical protein Q7T47_02850 [Anaerolineales bacterium]|nr:hypothetical protein [Anaerolineales bacterium]